LVWKHGVSIYRPSVIAKYVNIYITLYRCHMLRNAQFPVKYVNLKYIFYKLIDYHADRFDSLKLQENINFTHAMTHWEKIVHYVRSLVSLILHTRFSNPHLRSKNVGTELETYHIFCGFYDYGNPIFIYRSSVEISNVSSVEFYDSYCTL
jgi:hypothetical protein